MENKSRHCITHHICDCKAEELKTAQAKIESLEARAPDCATYEVECEYIGRLCERIGADTSCCYDKDDLANLIAGKVETLAEDRDAALARVKSLKLSLSYEKRCHDLSVDNEERLEANLDAYKAECERLADALAVYKHFEEIANLGSKVEICGSARVAIDAITEHEAFKKKVGGAK